MEQIKKCLLLGGIMNELVENYLQLLQEDEVITEDIRSFISRLSDRKLFKLKDYLAKAFKRKDKEKIQQVMSTVPQVSEDKLKYVAKKFSPKFDMPYRLTQSYIKRKYPKVPDRVASYMAIIVGTIAGREDNPEIKTKDLLISFDKNLKKALRGQLREQDDYQDAAGAFFSSGYAWGFFSSALITFLIGFYAIATTPVIVMGIILLALGAIMIGGSLR